MPSIEEDLGYIKRSIETLVEDVKDNTTRLSRIEADLSLYKTLVKFLKFFGLFIVFLLTAKFGDIKSLWARVFG